MKKPRPTKIWRMEINDPSDPLRNSTTQTYDEKIGMEYLNRKVEPYMGKDASVVVTVGEIVWGKPVVKRHGDSKGGSQ